MEKKARTINARFMAYMEKHRLYELFYVNNLHITNITDNTVLSKSDKNETYIGNSNSINDPKTRRSSCIYEAISSTCC